MKAATRAGDKTEPSVDKEAPSTEMQRLWFSTLKKEWHSLAVVPASPGGSAGLVGRQLARIASMHKDAPVKLVSAEGCDLNGASKLIIDMTTQVAQGALVIVVVDSLVQNPACIPVALNADAALMCIHLGESEFDSAARTMEILGDSRLLGSVTLELPAKPF